MIIEKQDHIIKTEVIEIPDSLFPMFFVKDHWAGVPTYWKITTDYIETMIQKDTYNGLSVEFAIFPIEKLNNGISHAWTDRFDYLLTDFIEIWEEDEEDPNKIRRITGEEYEEAKERYWEKFR